MRAEQRHFGIEFEFSLYGEEGEEYYDDDGEYHMGWCGDSQARDMLRRAKGECEVFRNWRAQEELGGVEFKTPKCSSKDWPAIEQALLWLNNQGAMEQSWLGTHFHLDLAGLTQAQLDRICRFWVFVEEAVCALVPARRLRTGWCTPCTSSICGSNAYVPTKTQWETARKVALKGGLIPTDFKRRGAIHLSYYNTLECRLPPCTLDMRTIRRWVWLGQALVNRGAKRRGINQWETLQKQSPEDLLAETVAKELSGVAKTQVLHWLGA